MSTGPAAALTLSLLFVAGAVPAVAVVGRRPVAVALAPLVGAVLASLAATAEVEWGGGFLAWFALLSAAAAVVPVVVWLARPGARPQRGRLRPRGWDAPGLRLVWVLGLAGVVAATAWSLRGLATPTVGFDARAVWLLRSGWFLEPHARLLVDFRSPDIPLVQSPYPPLVSAVGALGRGVTGDDSIRLGVVAVALLNACVLVATAMALLDAGRTVGGRLRAADGREGRGRPRSARPAVASLLPSCAGAAVAVLLVFVAAGVTEPFLTNGYADPIWSLAAVGAMAYGLQLPLARSHQGTAAVLVVVAGLSKNEGVAVGSAIAVLVAARVLWARSRTPRRLRWWAGPVAVVAAELALIAAWPLVMRQIHARGLASSSSPVHEWWARSRATYDGLAPYLHVLVLALGLALVGGLALRALRHQGGLANDLWAWAALAAGLAAIGGAFVTGTGAIVVWLEGTVHRVSEFPALAGWWIVGMWAVASSPAALAWRKSSADESGMSSVPAAAGAEQRSRVPTGAPTP